MSTGTPLRTRPFRTPLAILGAVAFAFGLLTIVEPSLARAIPIAPLLALLGNDYILMAIFGVTALLVVLAVLVVRGMTGINQTTPPDPEEVHSVPRLGEEFDEFVSAGGLHLVTESERHEEVRSRLREAAIDTVMRASNCTRAEASTRVGQGTWTDDAAVARFLTEAGEPARSARIVAAIRGDSPFQRAARRTAAEITSLDAEAG